MREFVGRFGSKHRVSGARFAKWFAIAGLSAAPLAAQQQRLTGDGFLFNKPTGEVSFRGGYSRANASSDLQKFSRDQFTIGDRGFDAMSFGIDYAVFASHRFDIVFSVDGTARSRATEYRQWLDNDDKPIEQTTRMATVGVLGGLRYNFHEHGRAISNFAWIPTQLVPFVGVSAGVNHYEFTQDGDFIQFGNGNAVSSDELRSSGWGGIAQAVSGMEYTVSPRWSLLAEGRYSYSWAKLNKDYSDFGVIDLSGFAMHLGASLRY